MYMNYSILFTKICFYPETSILLQIITNNSYDNSDESRIQQIREGSMPVLEGRLPVLAPRQQTR